jgi:hypothetical protein
MFSHWEEARDDGRVGVPPADGDEGEGTVASVRQQSRVTPSVVAQQSVRPRKQKKRYCETDNIWFVNLWHGKDSTGVWWSYLQ